MSSATNVAPVLTGCLVAACNGQQQEDGYVKKFTKEKSTDVTIAVVTALAVVTHARNRLTNGFQKFISLLLRHNGAAKWVIKLFNLLHLGVSYDQLLRILKKTSSNNFLIVSSVFKNNIGGAFCGDNLNLTRGGEESRFKRMKTIQSLFSWYF